jgi:hypothetical protein
MEIFISIASYQDPLLETTIRSAYENSANPELLRFGVCDQSSHPLDLDLITFSNQISYEHIDPQLSQGPCWARARVQKFYNNETYYLQIDSHMQFEQDWDSYMLSYLTKIQNEGSPSHSPPIITCYPRGFDIVDFDNKNFYLQSDDTSTFTLNFREDSIFCNGPYSAQITSMTNIEITHGYLIAAGCLFTTGEFVKQVPYDQSLYFYGEELSIALRAFTKGFGIYHIPEVPIYHLYTDTSDLKRKLHWDEKEDSSRSVKWHERESISINRLIDLINHKVRGAYGLGNIRTLEDFEYISGINLKEQKVVDSEKAFTSEFLSSLSWKNEIFS